jgi:hypothetical protein
MNESFNKKNSATHHFEQKFKMKSKKIYGRKAKRIVKKVTCELINAGTIVLDNIELKKVASAIIANKPTCYFKCKNMKTPKRTTDICKFSGRIMNFPEMMEMEILYPHSPNCKFINIEKLEKSNFQQIPEQQSKPKDVILPRPLVQKQLQKIIARKVCGPPIITQIKKSAPVCASRRKKIKLDKLAKVEIAIKKQTNETSSQISEEETDNLNEGEQTQEKVPEEECLSKNHFSSDFRKKTPEIINHRYESSFIINGEPLWTK